MQFDMGMIARHNGAVEPGIICGGKDALRNALRSSAYVDDGIGQRQSECSFSDGEVAIQGCQGNRGCAEVSGRTK